MVTSMTTGESVFLLPNATFFVGLVVLLVLIAIPAWAAIDIAHTPDSAFRAIDDSRSKWLTFVIVGTVPLGPVGTIVAIYYLIVVRNKLRGRHTT